MSVMQGKVSGSNPVSYADVLVDSSGNLPITNPQITETTVTISSGTSITAAIDLGTARLARITMPAAWTTANLTFQASADGGTTWMDMYDEFGTEVSVTAAASRTIRLMLGDWLGVRRLKIRSGTTGTPVNQAADRSLILTLVP